jgi:hypothetical protein
VARKKAADLFEGAATELVWSGMMLKHCVMYKHAEKRAETPDKVIKKEKGH